MSDWGRGEYERIAVDLEPAAARVVEAAGVGAGDRVLDVACGNGNAAALAAARGAQVFGLDAAPRLIDVARARVPEGEFVVGDACALPYEDASFDAVVSVFGVMFAAPAADAVAELLRVVRPGGRIVVTSWIPRGGLDALAGLARRALAPNPDAPPRTDWGDPDVVRSLFAPVPVEISEEDLVFTRDSARAWVDDQFAEHPMWLGLAEQLEPDRFAQLREESIAALERFHEGGDGLRITTSYWLIQCVS